MILRQLLLPLATLRPAAHDRGMNREKVAWSISAVLLGTLAFHLPGTLAQREEDYAFVRTLVDIHRQVSGNWVEPIDQERLREGAINGMLSELDPFTVYVPPSRQEEFDRMLDGSFKGVGVQLNQLENGQIEVVTPIEGSPAFKAGVKAGDVILKVNGEGVEGQRLPDVIKRVGGKIGTEVTLTVRHVGGEVQDLKMVRDEIVVPTIKGFARKQDESWDWYVIEDPKIAYLRVTQFTPETYERFKEVLVGRSGADGKPGTPGLLEQGMKGLILDLRFNPGGRLDQAIRVIDLLVDEGVIVSTKGRNRPENVVRATAAGTLPKFPMIVLVNEHSASASEIVAGSLMDNRRALVIGARSYGKGSVQELIPLEANSGELKLTVAYYYLPSGRLVHRKKDATDWGVQPQVVVLMDAKTEDLVLRARIEQEQFRKPFTKSTTQPATFPTTGKADVSDTQLQRAIDTIIGIVVLEGTAVVTPGQQIPASLPAMPDAPPATMPAVETFPIPDQTLPSTVPTNAPGVAPTSAPDVAPTLAPGAAPTPAPGAAPAPAPDVAPTTAPVTRPAE